MADNSIVMRVDEVAKVLDVSESYAYKIMKQNIISVSYDYISECTGHTIECDFNFENNNKFSVKKLQDSGYFQNLESPIDGKKLDECLFVEANKKDGIIVIDLIDNCY